MIDTMISKVVGWVDQIFVFAKQYSSLLVWGVVAMMVAKFMKVNLKVNAGKK
jgi:hypothetical protein